MHLLRWPSHLFTEKTCQPTCSFRGNNLIHRCCQYRSHHLHLPSIPRPNTIKCNQSHSLNFSCSRRRRMSPYNLSHRLCGLLRTCRCCYKRKGTRKATFRCSTRSLKCHNHCNSALNRVRTSNNDSGRHHSTKCSTNDNKMDIRPYGYTMIILKTIHCRCLCNISFKICSKKSALHKSVQMASTQDMCPLLLWVKHRPLG
mmetsp:Transcript_76999/g.121583  ORF Transcript_76999/g.121583 Transcript_76999/m.121583 type:complete len:200 (-) Transcript_76999:239-838(-)